MAFACNGVEYAAKEVDKKEMSGIMVVSEDTTKAAVNYRVDKARGNLKHDHISGDIHTSPSRRRCSDTRGPYCQSCCAEHAGGPGQRLPTIFSSALRVTATYACQGVVSRRRVLSSRLKPCEK